MFTKVHLKLAKPVYEAILKIAEKAGKKWEWKREKGDWFISPMDCLHLVPEYEKFSEDYRKECIPLLHWEDHLEPILNEFGWVLWNMERTVPSSDGTGSLVVVKLAKGGSVRRGQGKDRQEAFQRAILALVEE